MSSSPRRAWIEIIRHRIKGRRAVPSSSPRRAWIEISVDGYFRYCRWSSSPRRAWIEISASSTSSDSVYRRPPHGGRGLKFMLNGHKQTMNFCRPPHGGRGLK